MIETVRDKAVVKAQIHERRGSVAVSHFTRQDRQWQGWCHGWFGGGGWNRQVHVYRHIGSGIGCVFSINKDPVESIFFGINLIMAGKTSRYECFTSHTAVGNILVCDRVRRLTVCYFFRL